MQPNSQRPQFPAVQAGTTQYPVSNNNEHGLLPPREELSASDVVKTGEVGQSGTLIYTGFISGEEYNSTLAGRKGIKVYDEMRRSDATVRASLEIMKLPILSAEWSVKPASDDPMDVAQAKFIEENLFERVKFNDFLREALTFLEFGFSVFEKVYCVSEWNGYAEVETAEEQNEEGDEPGIKTPMAKDTVVEETILPPAQYVMLEKLGARKQTTIYRWETLSKTAGITQLTYTGGQFSIDMDRLAVFTYMQEGDNYEGISVLRSAYKHWYLKDNLYKIQAIALERQGVGIPYVKPPVNADETSKAAARVALANMRANEKAYVEIPQGYDIGFLDMGARNITDPETAILHHDRQIMKNVLAQFIELGGSKGGGGSHALSADQSRLFEQMLENVAVKVQEVINHEIIKPLIDYNFSVGSNGYPKLTHSKIADDNVSTMADAVNKLASASMLTPDPDLEQSLRDILHLPDLPEEYRDDYDNRPVANAPAQPSTVEDMPQTGGPGELDTEADVSPTEVQAKEAVEDVIAFRNLIAARERKIKYERSKPRRITLP